MVDTALWRPPAKAASDPFHYFLHVAVVGAAGVGKSELLSALTGASADSVLRIAYATGVGPVHLAVQFVEVSDCSPVEIEASTCTAAVFVYSCVDGLQEALGCAARLQCPVKFLVHNVLGDTPLPCGDAASAAVPAGVPPSLRHHAVNALLMSNVAALQRALLDDVWDLLPYPPVAALLPRHVTLGPLFAERECFRKDPVRPASTLELGVRR